MTGIMSRSKKSLCIIFYIPKPMEWGKKGKCFDTVKFLFYSVIEISLTYFKYMLFSVLFNMYIKQYTIYIWNHCHKQNNVHNHHSPKFPQASLLSCLLLCSQVSKWKSLSRFRLFATPWSIQSVELSRPECWSG